MATFRFICAAAGVFFTFVGFCGLVGEIWLEYDWSEIAYTAVTIVQDWRLPLGLGLLLTYLGNAATPLGHWHRLIDDFFVRPSDVYKGVKAHLRARATPGIKTRITPRSERGVISDKRKYLVIRRGSYRFTLGAMPMGHDYGVFWRAWHKTPLLERAFCTLPFAGWICYYLVFRHGAVAEDRALLFMGAVQHALRDALMELESEEASTGLSEDDFKPILADLFQRWTV